MSHPVQFTKGIRVLMLIDRSIGNNNKGSKRWVNKLISDTSEEFHSNLEKLSEQLLYLNKPGIRLYGCINTRDLDKSIRTFNHRQVDLVTHDQRSSFYQDIRSQFISCMMSPENRAERLYLVDIDTLGEECQQHIDALRNRNIIIHHYKTPNGWHVICEPFDVRIVEDWPNCEVKTDGLMIWDEGVKDES